MQVRTTSRLVLTVRIATFKEVVERKWQKGNKQRFTLLVGASMWRFLKKVKKEATI